MYFSTSRGLLTTRAQGEHLRQDLERHLIEQRAQHLEISFGDVHALTISCADEFLGRFLTELHASTRDPVPVLLSGLTDDTWQEVDVVLERRKLAAAAIIDGRLELVGGDSYLKDTFRHSTQLGRFTPAQIATDLGVTVQNANNRLKKLVNMGALVRSRVNIPGGGREFSYQVPETLRTSLATS
jgi:hypothetical protein